MTPLEKPTHKKIKKLATEIGKKFKPQKVILFGSWASGKPTGDSDVDLMVIMDAPDGTLRQAATISKGLDHIFPLYIIVKSPKEILWRTKEGDSFIFDVMTKGKVLYEAENPRVD
jgi:predicted nucleotidyltransferase